MKVLLGSAAVVAATIFGASYANANPAIFPGGCVLADGNGGFGTSTGAKTHIVCAPSGIVDAFCKADVTPPSSGTAAQFDSRSTGFVCTITCPDGTVVRTKNWLETVSASGEATLQCKFQIETPSK